MSVHIRRGSVVQDAGAALIVSSCYNPPYRSCLKGHACLRIDAENVSCSRLAGAKPDPARLPGAPEMARSAGDVEFVHTFAAKCASHRTIVRKCLCFQDPACRRHDVDQRPRSGLVGPSADDDVAVGIEAEAFRATLRPAVVAAETM